MFAEEYHEIDEQHSKEHNLKSGDALKESEIDMFSQGDIFVTEGSEQRSLGEEVCLTLLGPKLNID
jgi:hypothetical protein